MNRKKLIRSNFRKAVFKRDKSCCRSCGRSLQHGEIAEEIFDAHHITDRKMFENGGYVPENGICVCDKCHILCEKFHQTGVSHPGLSPSDLYAMIGSSEERARKCDKRVAYLNM